MERAATGSRSYLCRSLWLRLLPFSEIADLRPVENDGAFVGVPLRMVEPLAPPPRGSIRR
jgi:hypothetical protein